ncbi:MAG: protease complex subunit PrcB family protein [Faecalimonas sp.]|nr:protease complex subunit PrcB family protein [Faecalimonas sp.]
MKKFLSVILFFSILFSVCACAKKMATEKIRDIEFTVVEEKNIPEELKTMMEGKEVFKLTYADQGSLYVAVGYGKQPTSGYSIAVKECYETENAIYVHTNLIGPAKEERIVETATYPYLVIKLEFVDKNVVFQ